MTKKQIVLALGAIIRSIETDTYTIENIEALQKAIITSTPFTLA